MTVIDAMAARACQRQYRQAAQRHLADAREFEAVGSHLWAQELIEYAVILEDAIADEQILERAEIAAEVRR